MKIIEEGPGWSLEKKCTGSGNGRNGCGAVLSIEKEDLFRTHSYHYDGSHETYTTFKCIQCGVLTDIDEYISFFIPNRKDWEKRQKESQDG